MKEIQGKTKKELIKVLSEKRDALQAFRYELSSGKVKDVKKGRNIRKDIARIMTELNIALKNQVIEAKTK
jgi:ribosomal protein L29